MSIAVQDWSDHQAVQVFNDLDPNDLLEAEVAKGHFLHHMAAFAEWRAINPMRSLSVILATEGVATNTPFAVLGVNITGQFGVGEAALLARKHGKFQRELVLAAKEIRASLPAWAARAGFNRIEARSWSEHPTAGAFLQKCGFQFEMAMHGFGASGQQVFHQYAWHKAGIEPKEG